MNQGTKAALSFVLQISSKLELTQSEMSDSLATNSFTDLQSSSGISLSDKPDAEQLTTPTQDQATPTQEEAADSVSESTVPVIVQEEEEPAVKEAVENGTVEELDTTPEAQTDTTDHTPPVKHRTVSPLVISSHSRGSPTFPRTASPGNKDSSRPSSGKKLSQAGQPSPISLSASPDLLALSRTSSSETPHSPFLIPRNPFLNVTGKMPRFQWDSVHYALLENLLKSLNTLVSKWTRSVFTTLTWCVHDLGLLYW